MDNASKPWDDPESAWSVGMSRRLRKLKLLMMGGALAVVLPAPVIYIQFYVFGVRGRALSSSTKMIFLLLMIFIIVGVCKYSLQLIREELLRQRLAGKQGRLCPLCRRMMSPQFKGYLECPRCQRIEMTRAIITFWESYGLDGAASGDWFAKYRSQGAASFKRFAVECVVRMIENRYFSISVVVLIFAIYGNAYGFLNSASLVSIVLLLVYGVLFLGSLALILDGYLVRKGKTRHCIICEYQQAPTGKSSERCSECGADWCFTGAIVLGRFYRKRGHVGVALMIVWFMLQFSPIWSFAWSSKLMSTNSIIFAASDILRVDDVWPELSSRTISSKQEQTLVVGLLDQRVRVGFLSTKQDMWLTQQFYSGTMPDELVERMFLECYEIELLAPTKAVIGQKLEINLQGEDRTLLAPGFPDSWFIFGDWIVNNHALPDSREQEALPWWQLDDDDIDINLTLTPEHAGTIHITRDLWIIFSSSSLYEPIVWNEDGSPDLGGKPIVWQRKITLQHDIEVTEE